MTPQAQPLQHRGPRSAAALARLVLGWLLVAVLAVDLGTSPLHGHRHNGEWPAGGALAVPPVHAEGQPERGHGDGGTHADHDDAPASSHSIVAMRSLPELTAELPPSDEPEVGAPGYGPASWGPAALGAAPLRLPDRDRAGSSAFRSLPPEGRAPPLHA